MSNGIQNEEIKRYSQKIFLLNDIIQDTTISDVGIYVYIYLRSIQREDMNLYFISVDAIDYFYNHIMEFKPRMKNKCVEGLNDLESHGLIKRIAEKGFEYEYDLSNIYFNPRHTNKENKKYFTVIDSKELWRIMEIEDENNNCIKQKLIRYFVTLISTFLKGERYKTLLPDGNRQDGIVGFQTIDYLSDISGLSTDTVIVYNSLLEKNYLIYIYRANAIKLIDNKSISGISNTYGRYRHKDYIRKFGKDHKQEYGYNKEKDNLKYKSKKTTEKKRFGVKLHYLISGQKEYDKETVIQLYKYAVEYNRTHKDRWDYEETKKDLSFFNNYDFLEQYRYLEKGKKTDNDDSDLFETESVDSTQSEEINQQKENEYIWGEKDAIDY